MHDGCRLCCVFLRAARMGVEESGGEFDGEVCMDECMRRGLEMVLYTQKSIVPHSILSS